MRDEIIRTLQAPADVRAFRSDLDVRLFYEFYAHTRVGDKGLRVGVKYLADDALLFHTLPPPQPEKPKSGFTSRA